MAITSDGGEYGKVVRWIGLLAALEENSFMYWTAEGMVKLYYYSSESNTLVRVKWAVAKIATGGILMGIITLFAVIRPNQSVGNALGSRSVNTLTTENNILRQHLSLMSPRVSKLKIQVQQLNEGANTLRRLLHGRKIVGDTVSSYANTTKGDKLRSSRRQTSAADFDRGLRAIQ